MKDQIMKVSDRPRSGGHVFKSCLLGACLVFLAGFAAPQVLATTVEISAKFSPDPNNPQVNTFKNTTPNSGLCNTFQSFCTTQGLYSIRLGIEALTQRPILANHENIRDGAMIKVPAEVRSVQVTNTTTGQTAEVQFSITAFSATNRTRSVYDIIDVSATGPNGANSTLWGGSAWSYNAPAPCVLGASMGTSSYIDADYFWSTPVAAPCGKSPAYDIDMLRLRNASVSYLMTTPDPLKMESGVYTGTINYSVGPNGDFDFGDNLLATDNVVTMNLTLTVEHTLKFQFPAGYGSVTLNPAGGWQQWLNKGRRPEKLWADQRFKIWASSPFSVTLQCDNALNDQCAIKNAAGHTVPVATRLTLPGGLRNASNQTVERFLLSTNPEVISPSQYVDNGNATLHFEVDRDQVKTMIDEHSGSTYKGNITVIWNSEI